MSLMVGDLGRTERRLGRIVRGYDSNFRRILPPLVADLLAYYIYLPRTCTEVTATADEYYRQP